MQYGIPLVPLSKSFYSENIPILSTKPIQNGINISQNGRNGIPTVNIFDDNYHRHVGWEQYQNLNNLFTQDSIDYISQQISKNLEGLNPDGKKMVVSDKSIAQVISSVYQDRQNKIGDIYTLFNIPETQDIDMIDYIILRTIYIITTELRNEYEVINNNRKLTAWTTVLGDFNQNGLRSHDNIKVRQRNTNNRGKVTFMNY